MIAVPCCAQGLDQRGSFIIKPKTRFASASCIAVSLNMPSMLRWYTARPPAILEGKPLQHLL